MSGRRVLSYSLSRLLRMSVASSWCDRGTSIWLTVVSWRSSSSWPYSKRTHRAAWASRRSVKRVTASLTVIFPRADCSSARGKCWTGNPARAAATAAAAAACRRCVPINPASELPHSPTYFVPPRAVLLAPCRRASSGKTPDDQSGRVMSPEG
ncbi:hypothetical protein XENOCAPTIV_027905 [Xenoophorus captivus]|uniref:Secreted protein n=1 Tax=Xenoophorus captivus TaxID=1517983 RepID=A0ABV0QPC3_9TELE